MALTKKKKATGCFCTSQAAHNRPYSPSGGHCKNGTVIPGWIKHGFTCSRGHSGNGVSDPRFIEKYSALHTAKSTDIASAAADLYLLEAIAYDVANPRPFIVTDVDGFNFTKVSQAQLMALIGIKGPKKIETFIEKHGESADTASALIDQYEKWTSILAPNVPLDRSLTGLKTEANDMLQSHTATLAELLRQYGHYSNVSELCYHMKFSQAFDSDLSFFNAAMGWMDLVNFVGGAEAARIAAELFRDKTEGGKKAWGSSYGGPNWARAADVLSYYEDGFITKKKGPLTDVSKGKSKPFTAKLFCDRMFALQHNTGSILTKISWNYEGRGACAGYGVDNMIPLLDAHHNSDWYRLSMACSEEVLDLLTDYWTVTNREFVRAGLEPVPFPTHSPIYNKGGVNKPDTSLVAETPKESNKANIVVIGSKEYTIPEHLIYGVGKKVVYTK